MMALEETRGRREGDGKGLEKRKGRQWSAEWESSGTG